MSERERRKRERGAEGWRKERERDRERRGREIQRERQRERVLIELVQTSSKYFLPAPRFKLTMRNGSLALAAQIHA